MCIPNKIDEVPSNLPQRIGKSVIIHIFLVKSKINGIAQYGQQVQTKVFLLDRLGNAHEIDPTN